MSIRLYVGNLPKEIERKELAEVFAEEGDSVTTKVITDRKTGKCRGFGFVTVQTDEKADEIIEKFNGYVFKDSTLKIEKALPRQKGKEGKEGKEGTEGKEAKGGGSPSDVSGTVGTATASSRPAPSGGGRSSRKNNNKSRRSGNASAAAASSANDIQPDPRWANELETLKKMLAAQTTST
ncbi:MAG: RNA-binding protein [Hormoscilla sp. GUM202]|nr:RNA-binding protein [Hormoscilla sp. GUM202]